MQVALFNVAPGDGRGLEELNRFLRGHRVLTLDRVCHAAVWSFCVTYQMGFAPDATASAKVDYREVLDEPTFALFSRLRALRKELAEKEALPPYAVFTNEQLAAMAKGRCASLAELEKIEGVGRARLDKYGAAVLAAVSEHAKLQGQAGADRGSGKPA